MKKFWALILVVFSLSAAVAQQTETRELGAFSGVKAAEGIDVFLKKGDRERVKIEVTGTDPSNVITEISGSYLKIHMKDGRYRSVDAKVYVTYVQLNKLSASSAGSIYSDGTIKANSFEISASSAGSIEVSIEAGSASVSSSSAGDVELKGKAESIEVDASSAGEIDAYDLEVKRVEAEASSGGSVKVNVSVNLDARASSGGSVRYRGNPDRSNTNSSSGGSVRKSN
ncbi:MAG: head GIN domain-containing protein [Cyclobacteriaceae bacterium]